jgi:hypothetical protein
MIYKELTIPQKRKARKLIEKALVRDYTESLRCVKSVADTFVDNKGETKNICSKLFSTITNKEEIPAGRYNYLTGSKYLLSLINLLREGVLTSDDMLVLDDELQKFIALFIQNG